MHKVLFLPEILLNIFGHCAPPTKNTIRTRNGDLVALARVCRTFKEPALDILWEELDNLSTVARCLNEACCIVPGTWCFTFSRSLREAEWNTLRNYTRRVWHIRRTDSPVGNLTSNAIRDLFTLAPFTDALFPSLRSIAWDDVITFPVAHAAVPSLVSLQINLVFLPEDDRDLSAATEILDAIGERCSNMKHFRICYSYHRSLDAVISHQLCRWANLQYVDCRDVTLGIDAILRFRSMATLLRLSFTLSAGDDASHLGSLCVFSKLASLEIESSLLKSVTNLFSLIRCPEIKNLDVLFQRRAPQRDLWTYWATVRNMCTSNTLTHLSLYDLGYGTENFINPDEGLHPWLTLDNLRPYKDFGNLHKIRINVTWSVHLTDADILDLVSTSPQIEELSINEPWGWRMDGDEGGITLNGLVQLLRQCPRLRDVSLTIDTPTFTQIPDGLDVAFPARELYLDFLDSYISPALVPDLALTFVVLEIGPQNFCASVDGSRNPEDADAADTLWHLVEEEMMEIQMANVLGGT